jgi:hypothetical protein
MTLSICDLYDLHAGNLECRICGAVACTTDITCRICNMVEKFIDSSIDDILEDFGSLVTTGVPVQEFIESAMQPRASSVASKRLLHILRRVSKAIEERQGA